MMTRDRRVVVTRTGTGCGGGLHGARTRLSDADHCDETPDGHMMGTTGALEVIFGIKAIETGVIPPTINYQTPDPDCDLDYVPNVARAQHVDTFMSNAFGFGGHNAVLILKRFSA